MPSYNVQSLPENERPRERLMRHGPEALTTAELIAILLGSGMKGMPILQLSQSIIATFGDLQKLSEATMAELCSIKGLGPAKALQLRAALSLGLRAAKANPTVKYRIETPLHVYNLIKDEIANAKKEHFIVILQDIKGFVIDYVTVAVGTLSQTLVHPREVFNPAIRHHAASIILAHNHPSGDPTPSPEDYELTKILVEAGHLMGIPINDHLIIGGNQYISLRQLGISF